MKNSFQMLRDLIMTLIILCIFALSFSITAMATLTKLGETDHIDYIISRVSNSISKTDELEVIDQFDEISYVKI